MATLWGPPPPPLPSWIYTQADRTDVHPPAGIHGGTRVFPAAVGLRVSRNPSASSGDATARAAVSAVLTAARR